MATLASRYLLTPVAHWHAGHAADMETVAEWRLPRAFTSVESEIAHARSQVAVVDRSAAAKVALLGKDLSAARERIVGRPTSNEPRTVAAFTCDGPALACQLAEDHLLLLAEPGTREKLLDKAGESPGIVVNDATTALAQFTLVGPGAQALMRGATALDVRDSALPPGTCAETGLMGVHATLIRPNGTTLPTFHVLVAWDVGEYIWERLLEDGNDNELKPIGLEAYRHLTGNHA